MKANEEIECSDNTLNRVCKFHMNNLKNITKLNKQFGIKDNEYFRNRVEPTGPTTNSSNKSVQVVEDTPNSSPNVNQAPPPAPPLPQVNIIYDTDQEAEEDQESICDLCNKKCKNPKGLKIHKNWHTKTGQ